MSNKQDKKGGYTKYSNKIGLFSNDTGGFIRSDPEVILNFPFKDTILEGGMSKEDVAREERFLHIEIDKKDIDTLEEPKVLTDFHYIDKAGDKKLDFNGNIDFFDNNGNLKQNLLIKGNNLLALYTLKEKIAGKVKLIYIDPPYNTGSDGFKYNDKFNHSAWLVFMKNRLEAARELLKDDGVICVQCDDNEQAYLKVLMDEVFKKENFVNTISLRVSPPEGVKTSHANKTILKEKEYIHVFKKGLKEIIIKPQYTRADYWDTHYNSYIENIEQPIDKWKRVSLSSKIKENGLEADLNNKNFMKWISDNSERIFQSIDAGKYKGIKKYNVEEFQWTDDKKIIVYKGRKVHFIKQGLKMIDGEMTLSRLLCDFWKDISFNNLFQEGGVSLLGGKKPEKLIKRIIDLFTDENDIVLDYHLGSGTTAAVAHKMKRIWIGIEQMDYIDDLAKTRLVNVINGDTTGVSKLLNWKGGGSFIYFELKKYNQEYVDRIKSANSKGELDEVYGDMAKNAFLKFWFDKKDFEKDEKFRSLDLDKRKKLLIDVLDENQLYLNYADMNDKAHNVSDPEKKLTNKFYGAAKN